MTSMKTIKQKAYKVEFIRYEYKNKIYKSILQNRNIKPITYAFLQYKKTMWSFRKRISFQKKVCLILGKHRSVHPKLMLKRHTIKKLNATASIPNLSISKW